MRCGKPVKNCHRRNQVLQHRLQDLSDSAIKSGLGGNDNVCRPIKCNLGVAEVCDDHSFDSFFV
jgi:hypothetical protein